MGWFDDDEEFSAEVVTQKLWDEEATPIKTAVITAIKRDAEIGDFIMAAVYNSYGLFVRRYLRYGRDPDKYSIGLPSSSVSYLSIAKEKIQDIIEAEVGEAITIDSSRVGTAVSEYLTFIDMQDNYAWNAFDNILDIDGVEHGYSYTTIDAQSTEYYSIYIHKKDTPNTSFLWRTIERPPRSEYYMVSYWLDSTDKDHLIYWLYNVADGTYPELVTTGGHVEVSTDFYPMAPVRINGEFIDEMTPEEGGGEIIMDEINGLLKKIQLGYEDLRTAISGSSRNDDGSYTKPDDTNKDLDKVDDVMFLFAVDIYSQVESTIRYTYELFLDLHDLQFNNKNAFGAQIPAFVDHGIEPNNNFYTVKQGEFNATVMYNYVDIEEGLLLADLPEPMKDRYEKDIVILPPYLYQVEGLDPGDGAPPIYITKGRLERSYVRIRKRTSSTTYTAVTLSGPVHKTVVRALGESETITRRLSSTFADPDEDDDDHAIGRSGLFFPLEVPALAKLNLIDQEIVLYDAAMLTIYAADIIVTKWYQKGIFKILMVIVMIVVTVTLTYFFGPAGASFATLLWEAALAAALAFVISIAFELLMKFFPELALALMIIKILIDLYRMDFTQLLSGTFPDVLLKVTNVITFSIESYTDIKGIMLQIDSEQFLKDAEEATEELKKLEDMLDQGELPYDPLYVTQTDDILFPGETADAYLTRMHVTNPGLLAFTAMHNFVDGALALPSPEDIAQIGTQAA